MPVMLELLEAEEKVCTDRFDAARLGLKKAMRAGRFGPADGSEARGRLVHALMTDDVLIWGQRALRLKRLREGLEGRSPDVEPVGDDDDDA